MNSYPKNKRGLDPDYVKHIRSQPCLVCGKTPCDGHHTKTKATFGNDYERVPLCREHHSESHQIGQATFQKKYNISFDKAIIKLLILYIKALKAKP